MFFFLSVNPEALKTLSSSLIHCCRPNSSSTSSPLNLNVTDPLAVPRHRSSWDPRRQSKCLLVDIGYLTGKPMELNDLPLLPTQLANVVLVCDWWFFILFGMGWGKRLEIFFFPCCGLVVVVVLVVVVAVADGRGGCGWCCRCFLVVGYIILL